MTGVGALRRKPNEDDCGLAKSIAACLENESVHPKVVPQCYRVQVEVECPANRLTSRMARGCRSAPVGSRGASHLNWLGSVHRRWRCASCLQATTSQAPPPDPSNLDFSPRHATLPEPSKKLLVVLLRWALRWLQGYGPSFGFRVMPWSCFL